MLLMYEVVSIGINDIHSPMFNRIHLVCERNIETERVGMFLKERIRMLLKKRTQKDSKAQYIICQNYKKSCIAQSPGVQIGA